LTDHESASFDQTHLYIEGAEALGETSRRSVAAVPGPLRFVSRQPCGLNGDAVHELAMQFLALATKQRDTAPLMIGHRLMGLALVRAGDIAEGRAHRERTLALYDPMEQLYCLQRANVTTQSHGTGASMLDVKSFGKSSRFVTTSVVAFLACLVY